MKIKITFGELLDRYVWDEYCIMTGLNEWCINEGMVTRDEYAELTIEQAKQLGLVPEDWAS